MKPSKFFGYRETEVYTAQVVMAEPEKAVVDSLDKMGYAGGIVEVARVVHSSLRQDLGESLVLWPRDKGLSRAAQDTTPHRVDLEKLADYALRMESKALVQRLGYLLETLGNSLPPGLEDRLLSGIGKSKTYLGPTSRWGTGGDYDPKWQVVVNVPAQQLMGEIRVMS